VTSSSLPLLLKEKRRWFVTVVWEKLEKKKKGIHPLLLK
jgi:hypothetical protein